MDSDLYRPIDIGTLTLPNRFVRSATWEGMCDGNGCPTSRLADLYSELARGGVGLIISGYTVVHPKGRQMVGSMGAYSDSQVPAMGEMVDRVHEAGGTLFSQLVHAGAQTSTRVIGELPVAPSAVPSPFYSGTPRELSAVEIASVVQSFADAAARVQQAGFDGIQFHGAHGYLINQFLSPLTNQRGDGYGGDAEGRFRFLREIYQAVRDRVGPDYPVTVKLTGSDNLDGGLEVEETALFARWLDELGVDAIEVSAGTAGSGDGVPVRKGISRADKEAYNADFARRIRAEVDVPVILVGGLRSFPVIQRLFDEGCADLFSLSRPLIREPDLVKIWRNDPGHRSTCISCNKCFRPGMREGGIYCPIERKMRERAAQADTEPKDS